MLLGYEWPGNIRELENMIERGVILTDQNRSIDAESLFASPPPEEEPGHKLTRNGALELERGDTEHSPYDALCAKMLSEGFSHDDFEAAITRNAMALADDNVSRAARLMGITRARMAYRLEKLKAG
jgi:transcriptional regulator with PAS, ATPase and Fis domain